VLAWLALARLPLSRLPLPRLPWSWLPLSVSALEKFGEPFRLIGTEPDDGARLPPWLLERVAYVAHHRLCRGIRQVLELTPPLPGRFQTRGCVSCARDQFWITHRDPPPVIFDAPGFNRTGPSVTGVGDAGVKAARCDHLPDTGTDPPIDRTSSVSTAGGHAYPGVLSRLPRAAAERYSERCCGIPASRARTSVSR
jgi:hypothetical protein